MSTRRFEPGRGAGRFSTLVLAAGKGTRMKSTLPKVLHLALGRTLLGHVLEATAAAGASSHMVVVGHGREEVLAELTKYSGTRDVWQKDQKGTGHAAQMALPLLKEAEDLIVILNGDGPLLRPETVAVFVENHRAKKADLSLGVMELENPFGYGRVVLVGGAPKAIVEEKEATDKQRKIRVVNGGLYAISRKLLEQLLPKLVASKKTGELYLTDVLALAVKAKKKTTAFSISSEEMSGVNDLLQLSDAEAVLRKRKIDGWMRDGVRVEAPFALWMDESVVCEPSVVLGPNVVLRGKTILKSGAVIEAGCVIKDSTVEGGATVHAYSHLEEAVVHKGAKVGPYGRLRPGADIGEDARVGNFVEIKKSKLGKGSKANHLSYIGDAVVGEGVNIGCGFIACNYDGVNKNTTTIESGAFVGSGVSAVAPVTIGKDSYVATGTVVTRDVPAGALGVGRARQENKEGYAERLRGRQRAANKAAAKGNK
jgi:bifunctional UDP-N-acetylglucosamine pyrophosphorylase/glucosamine-1-phosphate N-acetyltransferase